MFKFAPFSVFLPKNCFQVSSLGLVVGGGHPQVSSATLYEKERKPKYVFNICGHQRPNLVHSIQRDDFSTI